jgi:hypothetical protein
MQALQWQASNSFVPQLPGSGQALPQAPQLFGSPVMSVQVPKQSVWPEGHWQVPPLQVAVLGQLLPQVPQLCGSVPVLVQLPEQEVSPVGHEQAPDLHTPPSVHELPQLPQLCGSVVTLVQALPQKLPPEGQAQAPWAQVVRGLWQTLPQLPQSLGSVERSTQAPQAWYCAAQVQEPPWQTSRGFCRSHAWSTWGSSSTRPLQSLSLPSQTSGE